MRFQFIAHQSLPRLAWCAHLSRGREVVEIHHGPWVETAVDWFVEGAWTGPFGDGGLVEAAYLVGTGGRADRDQVVFCSPNSQVDRVHTLHVGNDLYASNSMAFLLHITGDEPDPLYLDYADDRWRQQQEGVSNPDKRLPTAKRREIFLHDYCNVAIGPDLSIRRLEKPETPEPREYEDYVGQLAGTIAAVMANAADPLRQHRRYRPLVTLTQGYDSPALAALMRRHGASDAMTFAHDPTDDGTAIGERLGYSVTRYRPMSFRTLPGCVEAEFCAMPIGTDLWMTVCETELEGALLTVGRRGDNLFETSGPGFRGLGEFHTNPLAGASFSEFRLRVGFLHFIPYYAGVLHSEAIRRISASPAMKPWSIGGDYDRPIPRRILEDAGVPRGLFGQQKKATASYGFRGPADMTPDGAADFIAFLQTMPPIPRRERWLHRPRRTAYKLISRIDRRIRTGLRLPARTSPPALARYTGGGKIRHPVLEMVRLFHWGQARIRGRYDLER